MSALISPLFAPLATPLTKRVAGSTAAPTQVPTNTSLPTAAGSATVGQTIGGADGSWDQPPITGYDYQHQESATGVGAGSDISGAISHTFALTSGQVGKYFRRGVKGKNVVGPAAAFAYSAYIGPVVAAPAITGTPGTAGTAGGAYSFGPSKSGGRGTGFWTLVGSVGASNLGFNPTTGVLDTTSLGPAGTYGPFSVYWTDDDGIQSNTIGPWSVTVAAGAGGVAPSNTTPASIDNVTDIGQTGTATPGVWAGSPTPTVTGIWRRNGTPIPGATGLTYVRAFEDAGATLDYYETADNGVGFPVGQASNSVTAFHPSSLSAKAVAYFDASDTGNITQSGGAVSSWSSSLGNANPHTNGVGSQRPIWSATSYNGRPGITGDGVDDNLDSTTVSGWPITNAYCEEWAGVYQPTPASSTGSKCISQYGNNAASTTRARSLERIVISGVNRFRAANGNNSGAFDSTNTSVDFSGYHIVRSIWDGTNLNAEVDGASGPNTAGTPAILQARSRLFCSSLTTPNAHSAVTLGWKMIFSSALTTGEATSLRRWANAGAGITPNP